jgi:hypothetical protein
MNIPKHVIDKKKSMQKIKKFNVKWSFKDKIYKNHIILKFLKYILGKFQFISLINSSI